MAAIRLARADDTADILTIYAPIVRDTAISFELTPPTAAQMQERIERTLAVLPWLVADASEGVTGYAYASRHRERSAYQWAVDVSVYVRPDARGQGIARALYSTPVRHPRGSFVLHGAGGHSTSESAERRLARSDGLYADRNLPEGAVQARSMARRGVVAAIITAIRGGSSAAAHDARLPRHRVTSQKAFGKRAPEVAVTADYAGAIDSLPYVHPWSPDTERAGTGHAARCAERAIERYS